MNSVLVGASKLVGSPDGAGPTWHRNGSLRSVSRRRETAPGFLHLPAVQPSPRGIGCLRRVFSGDEPGGSLRDDGVSGYSQESSGLGNCRSGDFSEPSGPHDPGVESEGEEASLEELFLEVEKEYLALCAQLGEELPPQVAPQVDFSAAPPVTWNEELLTARRWVKRMKEGNRDSPQCLPGDSETGTERSWDTVFAGADWDLLGPGISTGLLVDALPMEMQSKEHGWCALCGTHSGWVVCGRCEGTGGYATKPGLAGKSGVVGWARCKTCYGWRKVPCLICGVTDRHEWRLWQEHARRNPRRPKSF